MAARPTAPLMSEPESEAIQAAAMWRVLMVVVISSAAAMSATAHPTGWKVSDLIVLAALGAATAAFTSKASTGVWLVTALAATATSSGWWVVALVVAVGVAIAFTVRPALAGRSVAGAMVGGVVVNALLRSGWGEFGWSAAVGTVVLGVLLCSGWRHSSRRVRRRMRAVVVATTAASALVVGCYAIQVVRARDSVTAALRFSDEGLELARDGRIEEARDRLDLAERAFAEGNDLLGSWTARPALALPILGQNALALMQLTEAGTTISRVTADAARRADLEAVEPEAGRIDFDALERLRDPVATVARAVDDVDVSTRNARPDWLLPPVTEKLDQFTAALDKSRRSADAALDVLDHLPGLLGRDGARHYFVAFGNPAEARDLGGLTGAFAELIADDGQLSLHRSGPMKDLNDAGRGRVLHDELPDRFAALQPERLWQNVTGTGDLPMVANTIREFWPQSGGGQLDGVVYIDPAGLASLLELTGPIEMPGLRNPLTSVNAEELLVRSQYVQFADKAERKDFLIDAGQLVFEQLTSSDLPAPWRIARVVGPAVRRKHLRVHVFEADDQAFIERRNLGGAAPRPEGHDLLAVYSVNAGSNKLDAYLQRTIDERVVFDPQSGRIETTLVLTLENAAPASGLPAYVIGNQSGLPDGTNVQYLTVSTPLSLVGAEVDGVALPMSSTVEYEANSFTAFVTVPPGGSISLTIELEGSVEPGDRYRQTIVAQPLVNPDQLHVTIVGADGWTPVGIEDARVRGGEAVLDTPLFRDRTVVVDFRTG